MKQCLICRRIYPDDQYAYCLEDGAVLSDYSPPERETMLKASRFDPLPDQHEEVPTVLNQSARWLTAATPPPAQFSKLSKNYFVLLSLAVFFLLSALYTGSIVPLMTGSVILGIYVAIWLIIKRLTK